MMAHDLDRSSHLHNQIVHKINGTTSDSSRAQFKKKIEKSKTYGLQ